MGYDYRLSGTPSRSQALDCACSELNERISDLFDETCFGGSENFLPAPLGLIPVNPFPVYERRRFGVSIKAGESKMYWDRPTPRDQNAAIQLQALRRSQGELDQHTQESNRFVCVELYSWRLFQ
jgi:hypothetical protein